jgi:CheY-like chemotaxis protein
MKDKKYLVVFVDDSPSAREMVKDGFRDSGHILKTATGVVDLETQILSDPVTVKQVDLFIFDFDMPYLTGTQIASALDKVYKELKDIPFFIFSGRPKEEVMKSIEDAKKHSATFGRNFRGFVGKKGESVEELLSEIGKILK